MTKPMFHQAKLYTIFSLWVATLLFFSCKQNATDVPSQENETTTTEAMDMTQAPQPSVLDTLRTFHNKYPRDVNFLEFAPLMDRVHTLIGDENFQFMKKTWGTEAPMEATQSQFIAWACEPHNCAATNFILIYDFEHDNVYAGVRKEGVAQTFSEDGSSSEKLNAWEADKM
ncbi:MAG: hypothetical protein J5I52_01505 [Saprospiraceae bacterium]|nr:hypothetical protein [Saprospiraceae bacterium]MCZ2339345.1 inhibitor of vertebrate lysozyme family protein [Chitinophagales bacterium]